MRSFFSGNLNIKDTQTEFKCSDNFIKELLQIWVEVNFEHEIKSKDQFGKQPLWYNSLIRIGNRPVYLNDWMARGITKVKHLMKTDSNVYLSFSEFRRKFNLNPCPLKYYGILSAIKYLWRTSVQTQYFQKV